MLPKGQQSDPRVSVCPEGQQSDRRVSVCPEVSAE